MVTKNPTIIRNRSRKLQAAREILDFMEKFQETNRARREAGQDPLHAANLTDEELILYTKGVEMLDTATADMTVAHYTNGTLRNVLRTERMYPTPLFSKERQDAKDAGYVRRYDEVNDLLGLTKADQDRIAHLTGHFYSSDNAFESNEAALEEAMKVPPETLVLLARRNLLFGALRNVPPTESKEE